MRGLLVGCSLLGFLVAPGGLQQSQSPAQPPVRLPAAVLDAADAGALPLAFALATRGVPTGVVTTDDPSAVAPFRIDPGAPAAVTLDDVVARFQSRHADQRIAQKDGFLALEQPGTACGRALDAIVLKTNTFWSDAARLLVWLSWLASGDPPPVPAGTVSVLGGREGDPLPPPLSLPAFRFTVAEGTTLRAAFDAVVRRDGGGAWIVWQYTRDDGTTGCRSVGYYSNGQVGAATKDFAIVKTAPPRRQPQRRPPQRRPLDPPTHDG